jgi:hypothetical protein
LLSPAPTLHALLAYSVRVALGLWRLEIVQQPADLLHRFLPSRDVLATRFFIDPFAVNGIAEMVVAFEQRVKGDEDRGIQNLEPRTANRELRTENGERGTWNLERQAISRHSTIPLVDVPAA